MNLFTPKNSSKYTTTSVFLLVAVVVLLFFGVKAEDKFHFRVEDVEAIDLVERFYLGNQVDEFSTLHVESIHKDFERKGFFRIGILPVIVIEGITIDIPNAESATNAFEQIQGWILTHARGQSRVEMRKVRISIANPSSNSITCGRIKPQLNGQWELLDGVRITSGTNRLDITSVILQVCGSDAGFLTSSDRSSFPINIFSANHAGIFSQERSLK